MSIKEKELIDKLDDLLPQTQCGLCNYEACRPYATAIVNREVEIDCCLPGGIETLMNIAAFLDRDPTPYITEMQKKAKPLEVAIIREEECIGCTKCIQVCPTDAIVGSAKLMHTIIANACTGCRRCLLPCPVDCIETKTLSSNASSEKQKYHAHEWRFRYEKRKKRLAQDRIKQRLKHQEAKLANTSKKKTLEARQAAIRAAVMRVQTRRNFGHEEK